MERHDSHSIWSLLWAVLLRRACLTVCYIVESHVVHFLALLCLIRDIMGAWIFAAVMCVICGFKALWLYERSLRGLLQAWKSHLLQIRSIFTNDWTACWRRSKVSLYYIVLVKVCPPVLSPKVIASKNLVLTGVKLILTDITVMLKLSCALWLIAFAGTLSVWFNVGFVGQWWYIII